ncbi:MAG TPA: 4-aminobutyrate--2-oxoglutarate transaminase [Terrimesophilobacter sp.]|nr:4-aminobutyrate--2-oxoglutarate transaminase [Terrimesophilobacter sp.]
MNLPETLAVARPPLTSGGTTSLPQIRSLAGAMPGPRSTEWDDRRRRSVSAAVGTTLPVYAAAAGGGVLVDVDGNSFIDFASGIAVTSVGSSAPPVVDAVKAQLDQFTHTCFMVTPYGPYVEVAELLNRITPGDFDKRTALFNSGAEAVENAVKIARRYTGRPAVVAFDHAYHGRTNLTMALTARSQPYKSGFGPFAPEVYRAPMSYPFRDGGRSGQAAAAQAIAGIESQVGAENLAAIILEPIQGEGGFIVPADGFLRELASWARANGVVFIADEVQTGFARTGAMFASEHEQVEPDLIVTAKGIAAGLPLAAVTGRQEIMDAPQRGGLGGTYGGNPLACVAALASHRMIEEYGLVDRARQLGEVVFERLRALQSADPRIGDVRGRGAMIAMELVKAGTLEPDAALAEAVVDFAHRHGVILLRCGTLGNVVRLLPPLVIDESLLGEGLDVLADAFASVGAR